MVLQALLFKKIVCQCLPQLFSTLNEMSTNEYSSEFHNVHSATYEDQKEEYNHHNPQLIIIINDKFHQNRLVHCPERYAAYRSVVKG